MANLKPDYDLDSIEIAVPDANDDAQHVNTKGASLNYVRTELMASAFCADKNTLKGAE